MLLLGLHERFNRKLDARERIVALIPEYAAYKMNRLNKGLDGKVPYERMTGKRPMIMGIEIGTRCFTKPSIIRNFKRSMQGGIIGFLWGSEREGMS